MYGVRHPTRFAVATRRWWGALSRVVLSLVSVLLVVGFYGLVRDQSARSGFLVGHGSPLASVLTVSNISIVDGNAIAPSDLEQAVGVSAGEKLLHVSVSRLRNSINKLPFAESSVVERRFPDSVIIRLVEREPVAVWQTDHRFVLVDKDGKPVGGDGVAGRYAKDFSSLPLIVGNGAPSAVLDLVPALDGAPKIRSQLSAAVRVGQRRWDLVLRDGCMIRLPEGDEKNALRRLSQMEDREQLLERPLAEIDMRVPDRLILRRRAEDGGAGSVTTADQQGGQPVAK